MILRTTCIVPVVVLVALGVVLEQVEAAAKPLLVPVVVFVLWGCYFDP